MAEPRRLHKARTRRRPLAVERGPDALLRAAERLFAEHSIEDVSMRQIVVAAGQANHYAVQHHFGDKRGLIRAILEMRMPEMNVVRERMMEDMGPIENLDVGALVRLLFLPLAQFVDEGGRHIHARFMLRLQQRDSMSSLMMEFEDETAPTAVVVAELRGRLHHLTMPVFGLRLRLASNMFLHAILALDSPDALIGLPPETFLEHAIEACHAVLIHPDTVSPRLAFAP
jgi:AcrR family transcriptional regulator